MNKVVLWSAASTFMLNPVAPTNSPQCARRQQTPVLCGPALVLCSFMVWVVYRHVDASNACSVNVLCFLFSSNPHRTCTPAPSIGRDERTTCVQGTVRSKAIVVTDGSISLVVVTLMLTVCPCFGPVFLVASSCTRCSQDLVCVQLTLYLMAQHASMCYLCWPLQEWCAASNYYCFWRQPNPSACSLLLRVYCVALYTVMGARTAVLPMVVLGQKTWFVCIRGCMNGRWGQQPNCE